MVSIGAGRGGDVKKWKDSGFDKILAVEPNADHIKIMRKRIAKEEMENKVMVLQAGGEETEKIVAAMNAFIGGKASVVSSMLSLSFFWKDQITFNQLIRTIKATLDPSGYFLYLTINGDAVKELFEPTFRDLVKQQTVNLAPSARLANETQTLTVQKLDIGTFENQSGAKSPLASLEYFSDQRQLNIDIKGTIVEQQKEWLVYIDDLILGLNPEYELLWERRADAENLLNNAEKQLTKLYTYGMFGPSATGTLPVATPVSPLITQPLVIKPVAPQLVTTQVTPKTQNILPVPKPVSPVSPLSLVTKPVTPVVSAPVQPIQHLQPVQPIQPLQPVQPVQPLQPVQPEIMAKMEENIDQFKIMKVMETSDVEYEMAKEALQAVGGNLEAAYAKANQLRLAASAKQGVPSVPSVPALPPLTFQQPTATVPSVIPPVLLGMTSKGLKPKLALQAPTIPQIPVLTGFPITPAVPQKKKKIPVPGLFVNLNSVGVAAGDDVTQIINTPWYPEGNVVRIATIGEGSCFFHSLLKAMDKSYQENRSLNFRLDRAQKLRRDLALTLTLEDPKNPGDINYKTASNGSFWGMWNHAREAKLRGSLGTMGLEVDFSLQGMINLLNSYQFVGDEVYDYVSQLIKMNIYVMRLYTDNLYLHTTASNPSNTSSVVIAGNGGHYETIGLKTTNGIQTVFNNGHQFIQKIITASIEPKN